MIDDFVWNPLFQLINALKASNFISKTSDVHYYFFDSAEQSEVGTYMSTCWFFFI